MIVTLGERERRVMSVLDVARDTVVLVPGDVEGGGVDGYLECCFRSTSALGVSLKKGGICNFVWGNR